jgi:hypothetical protein
VTRAVSEELILLKSPRSCGELMAACCYEEVRLETGPTRISSTSTSGSSTGKLRRSPVGNRTYTVGAFYLLQKCTNSAARWGIAPCPHQASIS